MDTSEQPTAATTGPTETEDDKGDPTNIVSTADEMDEVAKTETIGVESEDATMANEAHEVPLVPPESTPTPEPDATTPEPDATTPTPEPVCWICYETHADQASNAPSTLVAPCKCSGSLRTVHQECLLAWMAQTDATTCPHCHHTYEVDDSYPTTLQRLCDHPWLPPVMATLVCGALFYAFHRLWVRMTSKRRLATTAVGAASSSMSRSRLLTMFGGGLPAHLLMLPQMGGHAAGSMALSSSASWNLTGLLAEVEVFALLVMVVYGSARYVHKWSVERHGEDNETGTEADGDADSEAHAEETDVFGGLTASVATGLDDLWATVDDLWAQSASGSARLSHEEALYTLPLDILTVLFYVVQHYCKQLQTWSVGKERVVCAWNADQNNLSGNE